MDPDAMEVQGGDQGSTRRKVLKRAAVGAAAAWTVPMVVGTSTAAAATKGAKCASKAHAANPQVPPCIFCPACQNDCTPVGQPAQTCCCFVAKDGCCFCGHNSGCLTTGCNSSKDCPPGWLCAYTCCSPEIQCVQLCDSFFGTSPSRTPAAGPRQGVRS